MATFNTLPTLTSCNEVLLHTNRACLLNHTPVSPIHSSHGLMVFVLHYHLDFILTSLPNRVSPRGIWLDYGEEGPVT